MYKKIIFHTLYPQTDMFLKLLGPRMSALFHSSPQPVSSLLKKLCLPLSINLCRRALGGSPPLPWVQVQGVPYATQKLCLTSHVCSIQLKLSKYGLHISELYFLLGKQIPLPPLSVTLCKEKECIVTVTLNTWN